MSVCAQCGFQMSVDLGLCPYHHAALDDAWAAWNRVMCDLLHRGKLPPRLPAHLRDE